MNVRCAFAGKILTVSQRFQETPDFPLPAARVELSSVLEEIIDGVSSKGEHILNTCATMSFDTP
jgi:hypothetical protein